MNMYKQTLMVLLFVICGTSIFAQKKEPQLFSFSNNAGRCNINFNYVDDRIYIPATIEDSIECSLFLDSGIKNVSLDSSFFAKNKTKLHLAINPCPNYYTSLGGTYKFYQALFIWNKQEEEKKNLKIKIGNSVVFEKHPIISTQTIGSGIFPLYLFAKDQILNIHIKAGEMRLLDKIDNKSDSIYFEIDPYTSAPLVNIPIRVYTDDISYLITGTFLLDLGFRGDLILSDSILEKRLNEVPYQEYIYVSSAVGNTSSVKESYNISLDIDNIRAKNTTIVYANKLSPNITGIIGMGILKQINFALDYRKFFIHYHMEPPSIQNTPHIINKKGFGIYLTKKSSLLYVNKIRKGGKADLLGVKLLDKVIQIDNQRVTKENCDLLLGKLPFSKKVIVQKKDGKNITLQK